MLVAVVLLSISTSSASSEDRRYQARSRLLGLIRQNQDESVVTKALEELVPFDPSRGNVRDQDLEGEWKLLWSAKADAFSPLLKLPYPLKPESYQYLGRTAALEVGEGRVAQGLTGGILGKTQFWLSSGIVPDTDSSSSVRIIQPPFRFQIGPRAGNSDRPKTTLVEAGSDAEFRQWNARSVEAQQAPRNRYQQLYLELDGPGSLRISTITDGDPVIVGAIFCHVKL